MSAPFKRGDFVRLRTRPEFRGLVVEAWPGVLSKTWRATVVWENGGRGASNQELDLLPGEPFTTAELVAALRKSLKADRKAIRAIAERAEWLTGFIKGATR